MQNRKARICNTWDYELQTVLFLFTLAFHMLKKCGSWSCKACNDHILAFHLHNGILLLKVYGLYNVVLNLKRIQKKCDSVQYSCDWESRQVIPASVELK
jgi:hypothetical protein